jgi:hypothetical protein
MGEYAQAQHWHQESLDVFRITGDPWSVAKTLTQLTQDSCMLGDCQQATQQTLEAAELAGKAQLFPIILDILVVLARVLSQEDKAPLAVEMPGPPLLQAASHHQTKDKAHHLLLLLSAHLPPDVLTTIKDHSLKER